MDQLQLLIHLLTISTRIVPYIPPRLGYLICTILGATVGPRLRAWHHILANLHVIMPHAAPTEHEAAARRVLIGMFKNYFDLMRFHRLPPDTLQRTIVVRGFEHVEHALAQGGGVLIVAPHCGPYTIAFAPLAQRIDARVLLIVEQLRDPRLHQIMNTLRQMPNVDVEPLGPPAVQAILRALRNNHVVILGGDRAIAASTLTVPFFERPTSVPSGPATLALRTGTPLMTSYMQRLPDDRALVHFDPPLHFERTGDRQRDVRAATEQIAAIMAGYIRREPSQWLVAEPVWDNAMSNERYTVKAS